MSGSTARLYQAAGHSHTRLRRCFTNATSFPASPEQSFPDLRHRALADRQTAWYPLYQMVKCSQPGLDASFAALADATRRGVLEQLGRSDASITDLAEKFQMTLAGMMKHVGVLEQAGLVTTQKVGRVRTCTL